MAEDYPRTSPPGRKNDRTTPPTAKPVGSDYSQKSRPPGAENNPQEKYESLKQADPNRPHHEKDQVLAEPVFEGEENAIIPKGKKFPCSECGGSMRFSPSGGHLTCDYCGHKQDIPQNENEVNEISFEKYFEQASLPKEVFEGVENEVRCDGCGAMVMLPAHVKSDFCPFCQTQIKNQIETSKPIMSPGGILPFKVGKKDARMMFRNWVKSLWFAPNALKDVDKLDGLQGVYLPYWTYDSMTFSFYTGKRGEHYYVTVGTGKNRRRERRTRWYDVNGTVRHFFDDVTVCASKSLPDKMVKELEPWDLKMVEPYTKDFLSGFKTERYQISALHGFHKAQSIMDEKIRELICQHIGGDEQRITSVQTQHDGVSFKYLLLPVWLAAYKFNNKTFRVFVNARTGEVQGERPWSVMKITLAILGAIIAIALIVLLVNYS